MNKSREKLLIYVVIIGLGFWLGDKFLLQPYLSSWKKRGENIKNLDKQIADGKQLIARGPSIRADWKSKRDNSLPLDNDEAGAIVANAVRTWAADAGLVLNQVVSSRARVETAFTSVEDRVEVTGNITQILRFLYQMEKDPLAIKLKTLDIDSKDNGQTLSLAVVVSGLIITKPEK